MPFGYTVVLFYQRYTSKAKILLASSNLVAEMKLAECEFATNNLYIQSEAVTCYTAQAFHRSEGCCSGRARSYYSLKKNLFL